MSRSSAVELLTRARDLVERGWCQGEDATTFAGDPVRPWDPDARRWSLLGAIVCSWEVLAVEGAELEELAIALDAIAQRVPDWSLSAWNDDPARTQADVVRMLDEARGCVDADIVFAFASSLN